MNIPLLGEDASLPDFSPTRIEHLNRVQLFERNSGEAGLSQTIAADKRHTKQESGVALLVIQISLGVNVVLFASKGYVFLQSHSLAVLASWCDSAVDLVAQGVLTYTARQSSFEYRDKANYPAGKARLEPIGVMICAILMVMASVEVVRDAVIKLCYGLTSTNLDVFAGSILCVIVSLKIALWWYSAKVARETQSPAVLAVAQDNANDVLSNVSAVIAAYLSTYFAMPYADPVGAILISIYIVFSWLTLGKEQVDMLIGRSADDSFVQSITVIAETSAPGMLLDKLTAYHFGPKFLVELEMVMPEHTPLRESHDAGISLQHAVERLELVERCFVHIDYAKREVDDHDPNVPLFLKTYGGSPKNAQSQLMDGFLGL